MKSQHWFREWLGAVRQQAITRVNVDPDLCRHMVSLGHNDLIFSQNTFEFMSCNISLIFDQRRHSCNIMSVSTPLLWNLYIIGIVQDFGYSNASAMELPQSNAQPSVCRLLLYLLIVA